MSATAAASSSTPFPSPIIIPTYPTAIGHSFKILIDKVRNVAVARFTLLAVSIVAAAAIVAVGFTAIPLLAIIPAVICVGTFVAHFLIKKVVPYVMIGFDGGGERGVIPAKFLSLLEDFLGNTIAEILQGAGVLTGTSTGYIIASALAQRDPTNAQRAKYCAADIVRLYRTHGLEIFPKKCPLDIGLVNPKYSSDGLEQVIDEKFGSGPLDPITDLIGTSYSLMTHRARDFIHTEQSASNTIPAVTAKEEIRASTAAPTYFPSAPIGADNLVDGGMQSNNPIWRAYLACRAWIKSENRSLFVLSIDTGTFPYTPVTNEESKTWGDLQYLTKGSLTDIMLDAQPTMCDEVFRNMAEEGTIAGYQRFCFPLIKKTEAAMDDASLKNEQELEEIAEKVFAAWKDNLIRDIINPLKAFRSALGLPALAPRY